VNYENTGYGTGGMAWAAQTTLNLTNAFDNAVPLSPYLCK
jgi:hypothetical protein